MPNAAAVKIDTTDFSRIGRDLHNLPQEIKRDAYHAAAKRVASMARTQIVKKLAAYAGLKQSLIRGATRVEVSGEGEVRVIVRSDWIGLYKYGARQTAKGVTVPRRGKYPHAFIAKMRSGHRGVFLRAHGGSDQSRRLPIYELYGANPAHALSADRRGEFQRLAETIIEEKLAARLLHEIDRRISKVV